MNIFQRSIEDKRNEHEKKRIAQALVSAEITKLIGIEPTTDATYGFDQVDGYSFHNEKRTLPSNKWVVNRHFKCPDRFEMEKCWEELDYTSKDETDKFIKGLNEVLQSDESKFAG